MAAEIVLINELAYCREKAAPAGSNLHYAMLFETDECRRRVLPLFALHYEVSDCLTASTDPGVVRIKLNWWLEELARLVDGTPRHPVTICLYASLAQDGTAISLLQQYLATIESMVSGQMADISIDEWRHLLIGGLGQPWIIASRRTDTRDRALTCSNGGTILSLEILQNSLPLLSRGYRLIPDALLEKHRLSSTELVSTTSRSVSFLFQELIDQIAGRLDSDYKSLNTLPPDNYYERIMNRIARVICAEIGHDGYQLLKHRVTLTPIRKLWIAMRTRYLG